jgi:uncharacterized membrane protein YphA (DoxX/SURF4 family)
MNLPADAKTTDAPLPFGRQAALWFFRSIAGLILLYAGFEKLGIPREFSEQIAAYRLADKLGDLGTIMVQIAAIVLPWLEISAGLLLLLGLWTRAAGLCGLGLFSLFGLAVGAALLRGLDIDCGCFGTANAAKIGWTTLAIDAACWLPCLIVVLLTPTKKTGARTSGPSVFL